MSTHDAKIELLFEKKVRSQGDTLSAMMTVATLVTSNIGMGFLLLPYALASTGWVLFGGILVFTAILQHLGDMAALRNAVFEQVRNYPFLVRASTNSGTLQHLLFLLMFFIYFGTTACYFYYIHHSLLTMCQTVVKISGIELPSVFSYLTSRSEFNSLDSFLGPDSFSNSVQIDFCLASLFRDGRGSQRAYRHADHYSSCYARAGRV